MSFSFRIWLLNIVMAGMLVFAGVHVWDLWHAEPKKVPAKAPSTDKGRGPTADKAEKKLLDVQAYEELVAQNLFSPEREAYIPPEEPEAPEAQESEPEQKPVRISGEKVILYGVVITGGEKTALINNPGGKLINNPGGKLGEGKYQWITEGQALGNLTVQGIDPRQIVLDDGSRQYQILLSEKKERPAKRQTNQSSGPTVVSGGRSPEKSASRAADSQSTSKDSGKGSKNGSASGDSGKKASDAEYRTIETPFGTIKRKIK